jgi:hypothetical protein
MNLEPAVPAPPGLQFVGPGPVAMPPPLRIPASV